MLSSCSKRSPFQRQHSRYRCGQTCAGHTPTTALRKIRRIHADCTWLEKPRPAGVSGCNGGGTPSEPQPADWPPVVMRADLPEAVARVAGHRGRNGDRVRFGSRSTRSRCRPPRGGQLKTGTVDVGRVGLNAKGDLVAGAEQARTGLVGRVIADTPWPYTAADPAARWRLRGGGRRQERAPQRAIAGALPRPDRAAGRCSNRRERVFAWLSQARGGPN